jgi:hypothetical protein
MTHKNLCESCKYLPLLTTERCQPITFDEQGNVNQCSNYRAKNTIQCIINFIKKEIQ